MSKPPTSKAPESKRAARPRYTLDQLPAESDHTYPLPPDERDWVDAPAVGREILWPNALGHPSFVRAFISPVRP
jgi:hypothetical protein